LNCQKKWIWYRLIYNSCFVIFYCLLSYFYCKLRIH
jgi:hypothetical protein